MQKVGDDPEVQDPPPSHTQQKIQGKDRWQLTQQTLACLLQALGQDQSEALHRYRRLQERLIFFFMGYRANLPEDLADEVINRLAKVLHEGRTVTTPEAFALGVARMVLREERTHQLREQRAFEEAERNKTAFNPIISNDLDRSESETELQAQEAEFEALPQAAQQMLTQYHAGDGGERINARLQLAQNLGISMGALRKRVFDLQAALRRNLKYSLGRQESPAPRPQQKESSHR